MHRLSSLFREVLLAVAVLLGVLAVTEKAANLLGFTLTVAAGYAPARLLELAAIALLFVVALQLRELRHLLAGRRSE